MKKHPGGQEGKTILIVEDNELNLKLFVAVLQQNRFRVITAGDAETGIHLAREHQPDLILMDLQLPGMDGFQAAAIIKQDDSLKHIPVVALSGFGEDEAEKDGRLTLFSGFIAKPISVRTFSSTLSGFLADD
jgi:two-component system cell cycle response regulator DivK